MVVDGDVAKATDPQPLDGLRKEVVRGSADAGRDGVKGGLPPPAQGLKRQEEDDFDHKGSPKD